MAKLIKSGESQLPIGDCNFLLASTAIHLVAMIAIGVVVAAGNQNDRGVSLQLNLAGTPTVSGAADSLSNEELEINAAPDAASSADSQQPIFEPATLAAPDAASLPITPAPFELGNIAGVRDAPPVESIRANKIGTAKRISPAILANGPTESSLRGRSEFFGVNGYGQSFVYVVDCSSSMNERGKFERAKYELFRSIEQLNDTQKYFVILYNENAHPMPATEPVSATQAEFAHTRAWVGIVYPNGGTKPLPALMAALELNPDAIYFLSDGLFDSKTVTQLRAHNTRRSGRVPIHTIAFVSRENLDLMRAIARDSGGEFQFVR